MRKFQVVQLQFNALLNTEVDRNVIEETRSYETAKDYLVKRGYTFDSGRKHWIKGNTVQYPVVIEPPKKEFNLSDIGSFI